MLTCLILILFIVSIFKILVITSERPLITLISITVCVYLVEKEQCFCATNRLIETVTNYNLQFFIGRITFCYTFGVLSLVQFLLINCDMFFIRLITFTANYF
jgi:hypothetical protein